MSHVNEAHVSRALIRPSPPGRLVHAVADRTTELGSYDERRTTSNENGILSQTQMAGRERRAQRWYDRVRVSTFRFFMHIIAYQIAYCVKGIKPSVDVGSAAAITILRGAGRGCEVRPCGRRGS